MSKIAHYATVAFAALDAGDYEKAARYFKFAAFECEARGDEQGADNFAADAALAINKLWA